MCLASVEAGSLYGKINGVEGCSCSYMKISTLTLAEMGLQKITIPKKQEKYERNVPHRKTGGRLRRAQTPPSYQNICRTL